MVIPEKWKSNFRQNSRCDIIKHYWNNLVKVKCHNKKNTFCENSNNPLEITDYLLLTDQNIPMDLHLGYTEVEGETVI